MRARCLAVSGLLILVVPAWADDPSKPSTKIDDLNALLAAAKKAERATAFIHEGLPHPANEKAVFEAEKKSKKTLEVGGALFYQESLVLAFDDYPKLLNSLLDPATYSEFKVEKKCGGFHPDYEVVFQAGKDEYRFHICFGCHEAKVFGPDGKGVRADLNKDGYDALTKVLKTYKRNRPDPKD
jgi:hypothetical protein